MLEEEMLMYFITNGPQPFQLHGLAAAGGEGQRGWFCLSTCHLHKWNFVHSRAHHPLAWPRLQQAVDRYWAADWGLGTLLINHTWVWLMWYLLNTFMEMTSEEMCIAKLWCKYETCIKYTVIVCHSEFEISWAAI